MAAHATVQAATSTASSAAEGYTAWQQSGGYIDAGAAGHFAGATWSTTVTAGVAGRVAGTRSGAGNGGRVLTNADNALNRMLQAGQVADKNGLTRAGRALQKHGSRSGSVFPSFAGNAAARNAQAQEVLHEILRAQTQSIKPNRFGGRDIYDASTSRGVRFDGNGNMMGFLEP